MMTALTDWDAAKWPGPGQLDNMKLLQQFDQFEPATMTFPAELQQHW